MTRRDAPLFLVTGPARRRKAIAAYIEAAQQDAGQETGAGQPGPSSMSFSYSLPDKPDQ